ncbi:hypothetical protein V1477_000437 [Vespula maculifrons]|uniref:Uncharacterized protein n=1 Tax=Vespula maculifrons TaxID=7453 RepID=A0ABD2D2X1_VESMC
MIDENIFTPRNKYLEGNLQRSFHSDPELGGHEHRARAVNEVVLTRARNTVKNVFARNRTGPIRECFWNPKRINEGVENSIYADDADDDDDDDDDDDEDDEDVDRVIIGIVEVNDASHAPREKKSVVVYEIRAGWTAVSSIFLGEPYDLDG